MYPPILANLLACQALPAVLETNANIRCYTSPTGRKNTAKRIFVGMPAYRRNEYSDELRAVNGGSQALDKNISQSCSTVKGGKLLVPTYYQSRAEYFYDGKKSAR